MSVRTVNDARLENLPANSMSYPEVEAPGTTRAGAPAGAAGAKVIFAVFQTGSRANGGVESITQVMERAARIQPTVVTQVETATNERWRRLGADVHVWPIPYKMGTALAAAGLRRIASRLLSLVKTNARMWRLVRQSSARVVHCNDMLALLHTGVGARAAGARVVLNIRDTKADGVPYGRRWRWASAVSARVVVLSKEMRDRLVRDIGVPPELSSRFAYIYSVVDPARMNPPDVEEREQLRRCMGIPQGTTAIGYVATFNQKKAQLEFLTQAVPDLARAASLRVYFVGDFEPASNDYARACAAVVHQLGLERVVTFTGYSDRVEDWYRALDLVVIASRQEGLARCMIEAIACGTPVVSFDVCSAREILEGNDCGRVVRAGDYAALVKHVHELTGDGAERQRLGRNGAWAAHRLFAPTWIVREYENLYLELSRS